jgi:hypothetical protein
MELGSQLYLLAGYLEEPRSKLPWSRRRWLRCIPNVHKSMAPSAQPRRSPQGEMIDLASL